MCYKVKPAPKEDLKELAVRDQLEVWDTDFYYHADAFARPFLPMQLATHQKHIGPCMWGLIPESVEGEENAANFIRQFQTFNARSEEIFQKVSYRNYIGSQRSLLYVNGFYEPHHPAPGKSVPYYIQMMDQKFFTLGCIYSYFLMDNGHTRATFSIITTEPNDLLGRIHNGKKRMPLVIKEEDRKHWLGELSRDDIKSAMRPLEDGLLYGYQVSKLVNQRKVDSNVPEACAPVDDVVLT